MPKVLNKKKDEIPPGAVYVGRPTKWGNPYSHQRGTLARLKVDTREQAVTAYRALVEGDPVMRKAIRVELRGKDLVCWCAPEACHADVLLEIANGPEE